jgi:uridylate kinase
MARYQRVLLKLSGGAFAGDEGFGFDQAAVDLLADQILSVVDLGVQVAIMVGGGNIFRGRLADQWGIERAEADNIGMMATVINSLILRGALASKGAGEIRVMTAVPISSVAEPYIRLRAIKHLEKGYLVIFAAGTGQPYVTTDQPSVQRAIETRANVLLAAKNGVNGVYTADPKTDPTARRFRTIRYDDVLARNLDVMDQAAIILARDHKLPIHVFDAAGRGTMRQICEGADLGTTIAPDVATELD